MTGGDVLVLSVLALVAVRIISGMVRDRKKGCCGCCENCSGCGKGISQS